MGMVFQNGALFECMTVAENVAFVLDEFMKTIEAVSVSSKTGQGFDKLIDTLDKMVQRIEPPQMNK